VDRSQEGDDHSAICKLKGFDDAQQVFGCLMVHKYGIVESVSGRPLLIEIPGEENSGERCSHIGQCASKTKDVRLAGNAFESKCVFDNVL
jgi:hypothetical protein